MSRDWGRPGVEPEIEEALADPIVLLVLRRDRLTPADVRAVIAKLRCRSGFGDSNAQAPPPSPLQPLRGDPS
jgi:hypothetical protein